MDAQDLDQPVVIAEGSAPEMGRLCGLLRAQSIAAALVPSRRGSG